MTIQSLQNVSFKGTVKIVKDRCFVRPLDTDKIIELEARGNNRTLITYDKQKEMRHNGYLLREPLRFMVNYDINTILNAYNAAKNSNLSIDLSELHSDI